ncbi:DUF393 domain-containing protein [Mesobacillus zeae]|uniref:DUF393 domain-containing protein n=2 Tax=Mesobacillus zeae TaxID=1917180 RepID=A0A398B057_9BACI|nr:DUF393 domain-containing protein [Mesobacillus zeae]
MVLYDSGCSLCIRTKEMMKKLDWLDRVRWIPLEDYEQKPGALGFRPENLRKEIHVITDEEKVVKGFYAIRKLFLLFPPVFFIGALLYLPFVPAAGVPIYKIIAKNRHRFFRKKCTGNSCTLND